MTGIASQSSVVADTLFVTLQPWETFNLWNVVGSDYFATDGTGAILVFADWDLACDPVEDCDFLITSRTYNEFAGGGGTLGQLIKALGADDLINRQHSGTIIGMSHTPGSRTNVGIAAFSDEDTDNYRWRNE